MDFLSDQSGRYLLYINSLTSVPDYVKNSSVDLESLESLNASQFGDPIHREFPVDEPGHVYLSYAYIKSASVDVSPNVLSRVEQAGKLLGIEADLRKFDEDLASTVKSASEKKEYAIYIDFGTANPESQNPNIKRGGVQGFYPIDSPFTLTQSASRMVDQCERIPTVSFIEGCRSMVKAASKLGVGMNELPPHVRIFGVERAPNSDVVKRAAAKRFALTGDPVYQDIADVALSDTTDDMDKFASLWNMADDQNGLQSDGLEAYRIFHSDSEKCAHVAELNEWCLLGGAAVPVKAIAGIKEADLQKWCTKLAFDTLKDVPKKAATLSGPDMTDILANLDLKDQRLFLKLVSQ